MVVPLAFRLDANSWPRFDLVQGASRNVVHRLRLNTMQRPGHTGQKALAKKNSVKKICFSKLVKRFAFKSSVKKICVLMDFLLKAPSKRFVFQAPSICFSNSVKKICFFKAPSRRFAFLKLRQEDLLFESSVKKICLKICLLKFLKKICVLKFRQEDLHLKVLSKRFAL